MNHSNDRRERDDRNRENILRDKQIALAEKQDDELISKKKKLNKTALDMLRARFSVSGAGGGSVDKQVGTGISPGNTPSDLYSRITGR